VCGNGVSDEIRGGAIELSGDFMYVCRQSLMRAANNIGRVGSMMAGLT